jgi:DNA-binding MurR/RpiR family transcriptional regulator
MSKNREKKKETALVPEIVEPTLSRRHEGVIVALLANPKISDAARAAGVNESTIWRLMQREDFQRRYREAQEKAFDGALGTLQGAAAAVIATLQKNLTCGTPAAENQAANILLSFSVKVREQFGLEARIKQLEEMIKAYEQAERLRAGSDEDEE